MVALCAISEIWSSFFIVCRSMNTVFIGDNKLRLQAYCRVALHV